MTCNNIILSQPEAGEIASHEIPADVSARLNFSPEDIEGLQLSDTGELIVSFVDGGQLKLSNFDQLVDNGNLLYLEDGTLIDPSILTAAATSPQALSSIETAAGASSASDAIKIQQPTANTVQEISVEAGQKYVCDFDPSSANVEIVDGQMVLTFVDGSQVVINNYQAAAAGDLPEELTVSDSEIVAPEALLTEVTEVEEIEEILEVVEAVEEQIDAQQVANIEPAAGEPSVAETLAAIEPAAGNTGGANGNSGYGFNSSPTPVDLVAPNAIGPLGPTALQYGISQQQQQQIFIQAPPLDVRPIIAPASSVLDETALGVGPLVANGTVNVDYGTDGPGTLNLTGKVVATCDVAGGVLSSGGVPVTINFDNATGTYTGVANGVTVFTMVVDVSTGDYTYTQTEPFDHAVTTNDNEPICLSFEFTAEDADGDVTVSNIAINVLDDAPVVTSQVAAEVDETNLSAGALTATGQFFTDPGEDVSATFPGNNTFQTSGAVDNGVLTSNGVPVVVTFDAGTNTYTGVANGVTVFTMVLDPTDGSFAYTQFEPLDHADDTDPNESLTLEFGVDVVDFDGDSKSGFVSVNVLDDAPVIGDDFTLIDETNLANGPIVVTDQVSVDFGQDGQGAISTANSFSVTGSVDNGVLSHNGSPIAVTATATGYVGVDGNGTTIFKIEINSTTGDYEFTLFENLDHADNNDANDSINLRFGIEIEDFDGDVEPGVIVIRVLDDAPEFQPNGPVVNQGLETVDETALDNGAIVETGTLNADFGEDDPGTFEGSNSFTPSGSLANNQLTSCGYPVNVTFDSATNTYTGTANGASVFTLVIDPTTGGYTYTQTGTLDHADANNPNDVITLTFGVDAVDSEGEGAAGAIVINVQDDAPEVTNSFNTVDETDLGPVVVTGGVIHNFGNDGAAPNDAFDATGTFTSGGSLLGGALTHNGVTVNVTFDAATNTYTGAAGADTIFTMVVAGDGSYTFTLLDTLDHADPNDPNDIITLNFGVSATDKDGDVTEGAISIDVKDDVPTINGSSGDVDETDFSNGPLVYIDTVDTNLGPNVATIVPDGNTNSSTPLLSCGVPVVISQSGGTYTGMAGSVTVFTLTVDPLTGQYTYTQFEPLDHPDSTDPDDTLSIDFGVQVQALDGSTANATITINVADDGPEATNDVTSAEESQFITGDVMANDSQGQDTASITNVNFNGTNYPVVAGTPTTITAGFGTLVINADGTYNYTANSNDPDGVDSFTYTLTDKDGDIATADLDITVKPDGQPVAVNQSIAVDETNLTPGPMIFNGAVNVDFGIDGSGSVTPNGQFTPGGSLLNGALTSGGVPVNVTLNGDTYTGMAGTVTVFTVTINANGTYAFQLFDHIDHADNTDPNDIITMEFGITAADADGDTADGTFTILVHDDAPVAYDDGTTTLNESQTVTGNVLTNDESSEDRPTDVVEVIFNGTTTSVPATGTVSVTGQYGVLTIAANGTYAYVANSNNPDGTDEFTYVIEDFDGDQDTAEISFDVSPVNDTPIIATPAPETVDDSDLDNGPNVVTGTVNVNYQGDGPGEVNLSGTVTGSVALTSCGHPIVTSLSGNTITGTANGVTVFTMTVLENGSYTFTQLEAIDHPNTLNPNDSISIDFGVIATDADGDTATTDITIHVLDDGPEIGEIFHPVDEEVLANGTLVATGNVPHDFGQDGAGEITANGLFEAKFQMNGANVNLASGGQAITVTNTNNVYKGMVGNQVAFTLTIDSATGDYRYNQFVPIDHPDNTDPDDVIWLKFYVDIHDCDGDKDTGIIVIDVHDDGPVANDDTRSLEESQTRTGNVITNDVVGVDVNGTITQVTLNGVTTNVPTTGTVNVTGQFGVLTIASNGTYSYVANSNNPNGADVFTYTLQDGDGDTDTANLTFNVEPDAAPINISGAGQTDDTVVGNNGIDVETGVINVNYQGDGPGNTAGNGTFNANSTNLLNGTLSHNGVPINVTFNPNTNVYTGAAGALTVFTMTINNNGTYRFVQHEAIDHGNTASTNEAIKLNFGVTATDADGDTGTGTVVITVRDDAPVANDIRITQADFAGNNLFTGNVLSNDDIGGDGPGSPVIILNAGVYVTPHGTLRLNANGSFSFNQNPSNKTAHNYELPYGIQDADGDVSYAVLRFSITPLVLDLDGDGVEMTATQNGVMFDYDNDGELELTAWVEADDGFLVQDRNGDGVINDRSEMFGDMFGYADGFAHLGSLDTNNDGLIDSQDAEWSDLRVWRDLDQDGVSDENELFSLDDLGVESINIAETTSVDQEIGDNYISDKSIYMTTDGEAHEIADVHLAYEDDSIDLSQYLVSQGDELMIAAIQEASESTVTLNADGEMSAEDVFFVDQSGSVDEAIQEFVAHNADDQTAFGDADQSERSPDGQLADMSGTALLDDLNDSTTVV